MDIVGGLAATDGVDSNELLLFQWYDEPSQLWCFGLADVGAE